MRGLGRARLGGGAFERGGVPVPVPVPVRVPVPVPVPVRARVHACARACVRACVRALPCRLLGRLRRLWSLAPRRHPGVLSRARRLKIGARRARLVQPGAKLVQSNLAAAVVINLAEELPDVLRLAREAERLQRPLELPLGQLAVSAAIPVGGVGGGGRWEVCTAAGREEEESAKDMTNTQGRG